MYIDDSGVCCFNLYDYSSLLKASNLTLLLCLLCFCKYCRPVFSEIFCIFKKIIK